MGKDPMSMPWTEIPTGIWNGASQRFWVALGDNAARVASRINMDPRFVSDLATMAVTLASAVRTEKLLQFLFSFRTTTVEKFVANEKFVEGEKVDGVPIAWFGVNFENFFLGKIEEDLPAIELKIHKLLKAARNLDRDSDSGIISELGDNYEIALANFFQFLVYKEQIKDHTQLVAYICDENANLWTVSADWDDHKSGWGFGADPIENDKKWDTNRQVVSR